jgi:hypothetical protein
MVVEYCSSHLRCSSPLPLPLLLLPGESLDLHSSKVAESQRARQLMDRDRLEALSDYALSKSACLHQQYLIESTSELNHRAINKYFTGVIRSCPFVIKYILGDHVYIHAKPGSVICFIRINFKKAELHFCSTPPVFGPRDVCFVIHPYVLSDLCANRHFNSLGVSKRLEVWAAPGNPRDAIFNYLCNTYEAEGALSRHVIRSPRFWSVWLRRLPELFDLMLSVLLVLAQRSWHTRA